MSAFRDAHKIIVKVGTATLTGGNGHVDRDYISDLAHQLSTVHQSGRAVVLVSSGAIGAGIERIGLGTSPRSVPESQAAAAVGQALLMQMYEESFRERGETVAQILLTRTDLIERTSYVNAQNTFETLLRFGVIPVVNENDTVAVEEINFGDNDTLAAMVAAVINADLLVILSDVEGLLGAGDALIETVEEITPEIHALGGPPSDQGRGGMAAKLEAARIATSCGVGMIIAHGRRRNVLPAILGGDDIGTFFAPRRSHLSARKRWIAFGQLPSGAVIVNEGAREAICEQGKSLLPAGIIAVEGNFDRHDLVRILDENRVEIGRGLAEYTGREVRAIRGAHSSEIAEILGYERGHVVIHRDNLVTGL